MARIKGLEVLFSLNRNELKSKEDLIVAALHCILINSDYSCVGLGEVFSDDDLDSTSELLPENWNANQDVYCLRYRCNKDLKNRYLLKIAKAGNNLHVNLVLNEENSSGMTLKSDDYTNEDYSKFSHAFKQLDILNESFQREVLKKVAVEGSNFGASSSTDSMNKKKSSSRKPDPIPASVPIPQVEPIPVGIPDMRRPGESPLSVIPQIGGNDLDPFGRSQGSMFFDPSGMTSRPFGRGGLGRFGEGSNPMGLPPHAVPPGARFDPFSPIGPDRFNPNPDHFRPPDYDNMFL